MPTFLAQIAPQRSTQYAALATHLAPAELQLSPLGALLTNLQLIALAGQSYLQFDLPAPPNKMQLRELGMLATISALFELRPNLGQEAGPWLRPLESGFVPALSPDLVTTRRYRGKTNELFTHFLCNLARFSSELADQPWSNLHLLDPLAGGGTTLFTALMLGGHATGIELQLPDVQTTVAFLGDYLRDERLGGQSAEERLKQLGRRWRFTIGKKPGQQCTLVQGDTRQANLLLPGFKAQLIVADLPYGIQHTGEVTKLLSEALPVWSRLLARTGSLVFAWDATRLPRLQMTALVENMAPLRVLNNPPYDQLAHRVDRVIKERDVLVVRLRE